MNWLCFTVTLAEKWKNDTPRKCESLVILLEWVKSILVGNERVVWLYGFGQFFPRELAFRIKLGPNVIFLQCKIHLRNSCMIIGTHAMP